MSDAVEHRPIPGHAGYLAGSDGTIWSLWRMRGGGYAGKPTMYIGDKPKQLKPSRRPEDGRARYTVKRDDGTYRRCYGSALILESFTGPRPNGHEALHRDGNCLNDSESNLRWGTSTENKADMKAHGTRLTGESHPKCKLSDEQVYEVIRLRSQGLALKSLASLFGVTATRIHQIVKKGSR